ncbi:MAG: ornithine carbamoyltransferase [Cyanobacteria bacterium]|nr:ornithine carbamoyltransferase [Cyanobacteriota bacterium]
MTALVGQDFLTLADITAEDLQGLLTLATQLKSGAVQADCSCKVLGLLFRKASTRTRVSFSVAMVQLGGQVLDLQINLIQVSRGEPIRDTARVLSGYLDALAIRTYDQAELEEFAQYADIPIINALTDQTHPCQILADLLTVQECFGQLAGTTLAYLGDGNNMAHSLMLGCALAGVNIRVATPPDYVPDAAMVKQAQVLAGDRCQIQVTTDPKAAVEGANILYTDVWASMGQEDSAESRIPIFQPYQVNAALLALAEKEAIVLHCLPAHRGEEITDAVLEGSQSQIWRQAENRMHAQKALLASLLGGVTAGGQEGVK